MSSIVDRATGAAFANYYLSGLQSSYRALSFGIPTDHQHPWSRPTIRIRGAQ